MEFVIGIMIIALVLCLIYIFNLNFQLGRMRENYEDAENVAQNLETRIEMLDMEVSSERRLQQIWRSRAMAAWQNGYLPDIGAEAFEVDPCVTFGSDAVREVVFDGDEENERDA